MNRILLLPILAVAGWIGLATGVNAQSATSTHSGTVSTFCSITAVDGALVPVTNIINGGNFPTEITSSTSPGKFTTLCNKSTVGITTRRTSVTTPPDQGGGITSSYSLSASGGSAYVGNSILGIDITGGANRTGTISHGFSSTPSDLIVSAKSKVANGFILGEGDYEIRVQATLTP